MGPRVHFDSEVNALCVVPHIDSPPIILESASDAEDVETMHEKPVDSNNDVGDDDDMDDDMLVPVENNLDKFDDDELDWSDDDARSFVTLVDNYDLPVELLDRIEAFHTYISRYANKNGDTTSEEYLLTRQLLLAEINAYMNVWMDTNPKTRAAQQEEKIFGTSDEDEKDEDDADEASDETVDTDPDESPRAQPKV